MPDYIWEYNWNGTGLLGHHYVVRQSFAKCKESGQCEGTYTLAQQAAMVMHSVGLISVTGAAFVWQAWLPPGSVLLIISRPGDVAGVNFECRDLVQTWHENIAIHAGHSNTHWRLCGGEQ